jgi:hypothetical protein
LFWNQIDKWSGCPKSWKIEGSNNNTVWTLINEQKDQPNVSYPKQDRIYQCQSQNYFSFFKITQIDSNFQNNHCFQFDYIEFLVIFKISNLYIYLNII